MADKNIRFMLNQDQEGHWYVIPENKKDEWFDWMDSEDYDMGVIPDWAKPINGCYTRVKFSQYEII